VYARASQPTIAANPAPANYVFRRWTGCSVTDANAATTTLLPMTSDQSCVAVFEHRVRVTLSPPEVGTVTTCSVGSPCYVADGGSIALTPVANSNYAFTGWSGCQGNVARNGVLTINPVTTNLDCVATYRRLQFTVTTQIMPVGANLQGTATCSGQTPCVVNSGDTLRLTATPTSATAFVGWSGCIDSTSATVDLTVTPTTVLGCVATFRPRQPDLVISDISAGVPVASKNVQGVPVVQIPLKMVVTNKGEVAASPSSRIVVLYKVKQGTFQANYYATLTPRPVPVQMPESLAPGASATFDGTFQGSPWDGTSLTLQAEVDSCYGDTTNLPAYCLIQEIDEKNNFSTVVTVNGLPLAPG
jgi:hypothetical protein